MSPQFSDENTEAQSMKDLSKVQPRKGMSMSPHLSIQTSASHPQLGSLACPSIHPSPSSHMELEAVCVKHSLKQKNEYI